MTPELIYQLLAGLFLAGAVYGGIRADLRAMHQQIIAAEKSADKAHDRLDNHLGNNHAHV